MTKLAQHCGLVVIILSTRFMSSVFSTEACPDDCKCNHDHTDNIGDFYNVICTNLELLEVPDLQSLSQISDPIHIALDTNEISYVSDVDFPAGLNIFSLDLSQNKGLEIHEDAFLNLAGTLKTLILEAISLKFDQTLKMLSELRHLEDLSISHNNRRFYVDGAVENVMVPLFDGPVSRSLKTLTMSFCGIRSMSVKVLDSLAALEELDLSNNWFTQVPAGISHLKQLKKLLLFRGNISTLEDYKFKGMSDLEVIEINTNRLHTIQRFAFNGLEDSLKRLRLDRCRLTQIPFEALMDLKALEHLDLTQNSFTSAPASSFVGKYCLKELLVSAEGMQFDKDTFSGQKECIKDLTIKHMKLTEVPREAIAQLKKLSRLGLESNEITVLPPDAFSGIKATHINLANNPLTVIKPEAFSGLPPQMDINLRRTKIADIDFLRGYPENAIGTVNLDYTEIVCQCSMKASLNVTLHVNIYGTCKKGVQVVPLSSSRIEGVIDLACKEEQAMNGGIAFRLDVMLCFVVVVGEFFAAMSFWHLQ